MRKTKMIGKWMAKSKKENEKDKENEKKKDKDKVGSAFGGSSLGRCVLLERPTPSPPFHRKRSLMPS